MPAWMPTPLAFTLFMVLVPTTRQAKPSEPEGPALAFCPPLRSIGPGAMPADCDEEIHLQDGMMLSFYGHIEELEWALADASEAGRAPMDLVNAMLSFAESLNLMLCMARFRCVYPTTEEFQSDWNASCDQLLARAPPNFPWLSREPCSAGNELMEVVSLIIPRLRSDFGLPGRGARYPLDVAPVCGAVAQADFAQTWPFMFLNGTYGHHVVSTTRLPFAEILEFFRQQQGLMPSELVVVNLGAHDGSCMDAQMVVKDVANCAFDLGARGVAVEGLETTALQHRWPGVVVHVGYISPRNVTRIVEDALAKLAVTRVDLLKIDLDHADCFFAEALLRQMRLAPAFLVVEYNRIFPPPIRFREQFSETKAGRMGLSWMDGKRGQHWSGCSMQAWHDTAAAHGYRLLQATLFDLTFLHQNVELQLGVEVVDGWPSSIFNAWLSSAHCFAPSRRLYGHQAFATLDLRALPELPADDRCELAARWWKSEGQTSQSELYC
ncbi:ODA2 [Symbiodinium microadriaticum]|nr:ODA2 [Symbiodinium microadriaticum]CAE7671544.1 ODA2 [Symbiodinium sp. KB8]